MEQFKIDLDKCWTYPRTKQGLEDAAMDGCYPVIKQFNEHHSYLFDEPQNKYNRYNMFLNACCRGHIDIVKWIVDEFPLLLMLATAEDVFLETCASGKIHVARWLYTEVPEIDVRLEDDYAFLSALHNKHYHVCKWLYSLDFSIPINTYFKFICKFGDLNSCIFLHQLMPSILYADKMEAYKNACYYEHIELVKWFCGLFLEDLPERQSTEPCMICYDKGDTAITHCGHEFCKACISSTMTNLCTNECPYCRQNMLPFKK